MGLLDTPLRAVSESLLNTFGTTFTLRQVSLGVVNTTAGTQATTPTDTVLKGRLDDYKNFEISDVVQATDQKLTMAASLVSFVPDLNDQVVIASVVYAIKDVKPILATDENALLVLQLRAGG